MATSIHSIDTTHEGMIHDAQLDYYGRRLATCASDRSIKIFDVSGSEQRLTGEILAHSGPVWQVAWSHPQFGGLLASCGYDRRAMIHREVGAGNWTKLYAFTEHSSSVNSIAFAPYEYGLQLATASSDGNVAILTRNDDDSWTANMFRDCTLGCNAISWAPSSHLGGTSTNGEAVTFVKRVAVASSDGQIRIHRGDYDFQTGQEKWILQTTLPNSPHRNWVRDVAWSPASGFGGNILASCSDDGIVGIWSQDKEDSEFSLEVLPEFPAPAWRVSWNTTGQLLAVTCSDNSVTLWKQSLEGQWFQISSVPDPTIQASSQQY